MARRTGPGLSIDSQSRPLGLEIADLALLRHLVLHTESYSEVILEIGTSELRGYSQENFT